jgi:hypothetical protein
LLTELSLRRRGRCAIAVAQSAEKVAGIVIKAARISLFSVDFFSRLLEAEGKAGIFNTLLEDSGIRCLSSSSELKSNKTRLHWSCEAGHRSSTVQRQKTRFSIMRPNKHAGFRLDFQKRLWWHVCNG